MPRRLKVRSSFMAVEEALKLLEGDVKELRERYKDLEAVGESLIERIQAIEERMKSLEKEVRYLRYWLRERGII